MLVPLGVIGIHARGVNGDVNGAVFRVLGVVNEFAVEIVKSTVKPAVAKMRNLEGYELMGSLFIKRIGAAVFVSIDCTYKRHRHGRGKQNFFHGYLPYCIGARLPGVKR